MRARIAAGVLGSALLLTTVVPSAGGTTEPVVTASSQATPGKEPVRSYGSPAVVVDPDDPRKVYAAGVEFRNQRCVFLRSADGGRTWRQLEPPSPTGAPICTHNLGVVPVGFLAMGRDKTLYWAHTGTSIEDLPNLSVFLARSTDGGDTWTSTVVRDVRGRRGAETERNILTDLAIDSTGPNDRVYVTWMTSWLRLMPPRAPRAMVAASSDGGRTFGDPVEVTEGFFEQPANLPTDVPPERLQPPNFGSTQPNLSVSRTGDLYVVWMELALTDPLHSPVRWRRMYVSRSADGGKTFTEHAVARTMTAEGAGLLNPMLEWSPAGGPEGSLHLVYESRAQAAQGDRDVQYQRSLDGGRTWSEVKALNDDDPKQLFGQFLPNVQVAPNGRVDVAWWDLRDGAARYATDVYYSSSQDAGQTWSKNMRVTERSIDRKIGIWTDNSDTRQPPGLGSADELAVLVWDDTRHGDHVTDTQDLRAAAVQFAALDDGTTTSQRLLAYGLAALSGTGAVGLVLVVAGLVARRRISPPVPEREVEASPLANPS